MKRNIIFLTLLCCISISDQQKEALLFERANFKIYTDKAFYDDSVLYDTAKDYRRICEVEEEGIVKCAEGIIITYRLLSLVGDYYSYERNRYDTGAGGDCYRNPSSEVSVKSTNVVTGERVSLSELVEEASLVTALKNDAWVRDMYGTMDMAKLESKNTFQEIIDLINSNMGLAKAFDIDNFAAFI